MNLKEFTSRLKGMDISNKVWPEMEQRSEQWFLARAGRPTASQFHRIITPLGKDSTSWEEYVVELCSCLIKPKHIDVEHYLSNGFYGNKHIDRGNEMEPFAISALEDAIGMPIKLVGFITDESGMIGCSPDGLVIGPDGLPVAGAEAKCPLPKIHGMNLVRNSIDPKYKPQVHGSMAVSGLKAWFFTSFHEDFPSFIDPIEWDDYTFQVKDALERFMAFYQERRDEVCALLRKEAA